MITLTIEHTCHGVDHTAPVTFSRTVELTDGRTERLEGIRCDGTAIHHYRGRTPAGGERP